MLCDSLQTACKKKFGHRDKLESAKPLLSGEGARNTAGIAVTDGKVAVLAAYVVVKV